MSNPTSPAIAKIRAKISKKVRVDRAVAKAKQLDLVPVFDADGNLIGVVDPKDIAEVAPSPAAPTSAKPTGAQPAPQQAAPAAKLAARRR